MKRDPQEIGAQAETIALKYLKLLKDDYPGDEIYRLISAVFNHLTNRHTPETLKYFDSHPNDTTKVIALLKESKYDCMRISEVADVVDYVRMWKNPNRDDPTAVTFQKEAGIYVKEEDPERPLSLDVEKSIATAYGAQAGSGCAIMVLVSFTGYLLFRTCLEVLVL